MYMYGSNSSHRYSYECLSESNDVHCLDEVGTCSRAACRCDSRFARCAHKAQFHEKFARKHIDYNICAQLDADDDDDDVEDTPHENSRYDENEAEAYDPELTFIYDDDLENS